MKMTVFWDILIIALMMMMMINFKTSQPLASFYQTTRRNTLE
jgi:hypothetical protein